MAMDEKAKAEESRIAKEEAQELLDQASQVLSVLDVAAKGDLTQRCT